MVNEELWEDVILHTSINRYGAVSYQSGTEQRWLAAGEDFELLHSVIEDNIFEYDEEDDSCEDIDWMRVQRDYEKTKSRRQHAS